MSAKAKKPGKSKTSAKAKTSVKAKTSAKTKTSARTKMTAKAKMSAETEPRRETENRYRVFEPEKGSDSTVEIGIVTLSRDHKLGLVSALSGRRQFLDAVVASANAREVVHLMAPPPPRAPAHAIYTRPVKRSDAGFREALVASLKINYRIELKPA